MFLDKRVFMHRTEAYRELAKLSGGIVLKCKGAPFVECPLALLKDPPEAPQTATGETATGATATSVDNKQV